MTLVEVECTNIVDSGAPKQTTEFKKSAIWVIAFPAGKTIAFPTVDELMTEGSGKYDGDLPFSRIPKDIVSGEYDGHLDGATPSKSFRLVCPDGQTTTETTVSTINGAFT